MTRVFTSGRIEEIAQVCHEANRSYCSTIGDHSQVDWYHAPAWQRSSAIDGVQFHIANPGASASASHENWLKEKERDGWGYGPEKDTVLKTHPCFVPYNQLPLAQRRKDYLFKAVVESLTSGVESE